MILELKGVTKSYGPLRVMRNFSASFPAHEIGVLLGPSGCGKTTILNLLAGLLKPDAGDVTIGGIPAAESRVSYLFQEPRLLPWLTVEKNLDFILSPRLPTAERYEKIEKYLREVSLYDARRKYPFELSGGMARRAAMARAFLFESNALLMDEPFQGLDLPLKFQLMKSFEKARRLDRKTTLFVTHDIEEALLLGDRIHVLSPPPTHIVYSLDHPVPREERIPGHPLFSALERDLFQILVSESR
jgi:NitT/TauT family transport system ATP-binding protein